MASIQEPEIWLRAGRANANPPEGEDIVITGLSGCFPESNNVYEFRDNLASKADMVTYDTRRWEAIHPEIPKRAGKIWNVEKFDAGFFGVHQHQCQAVDPLCRILIEKCFECVLDAGLNPKELEGTNTGIYVGACASESEKYWFYDNLESKVYAITGCHRSMLAARVAYALRLQGPAFVMDTACSSSFFAFEHAYRAIREGRCDRAIVAGTNLCLHPYVTLQFSRLGVLSLDGACKCFDDSANGYTRSEAICAILLQPSKEAKRIYAQVVHSKVNSDGYKEQGITYPSGDTQKNLIREVYMECQLDPAEISYMEAHGTGTKVGDPEELKAIDDIFLKNRQRPLLIGSVKSNIGHTEPTSGLCSITKVILSYEGDKILPNMNYQNPRQGFKALKDGSLVVVTDNTEWPDDKGLVGINSFGFGGANCHTILRWNQRTQKTQKNRVKAGNHNLPLLICLSGRTLEAVQVIVEDLKNRYENPEYIGLYHEVFRYNISGHNYRGMLLVDRTRSEPFIENIRRVPDKTPELIYWFDAPTNFWIDKGKALLQIKIFRDSIERMQCLKIGFNLINILEDPDQSNETHQVVTSLCTQLALIELLAKLNLKFAKFGGISIGQIICAYLDGLLTFEDTLELGYSLIVQKKIHTIKENNIWGVPSRKWITHKDCRKNLKNSVIIHFGPSQENGIPSTLINLFDCSPENTTKQLLAGLGALYLLGIPIDISKIYPKVQFPVGRGTPMISPLIKWDHSRDWFVTKYRTQDIVKTGFIYVPVGLKDEYWKYLSGHVADGRNLFPATGYLVLAWDVLGMITGKIPGGMSVLFENVRFLRATTIPTKGTLFFTVMVQRGTGNFEIVDGGVPVATGTITEYKEESPDLDLPPNDPIMLSQKDVYTELKLRGYNYRGAFKCIKEVDLSCSFGSIEWTGNWVTFLDNMLQMQILQRDTRALYVPTGIKRILIDAPKLYNIEDPSIDVPVHVYKDLDLIRSGGVEMRGFLANVINRKKVPEAVLEKYVFVPNEVKLDLDSSLRVIIQVALENFPQHKIKIVEITDQDPVSPLIRNSLDDLPLIEADLRIFTQAGQIEVEPQYRIVVENKNLSQEIDCYLIVVDPASLDIVGMSDLLRKSLKPEGFVVVKSIPGKSFQMEEDFTRLLTHETPSVNLNLYRRYTAKNEVYLEYDEQGTCLKNIQNLKDSKDGLVIWSKSVTNGLLGFTNCLRREPCQVSRGTRCVTIDDLKVAIDGPQVKGHLAKGLAINVLRQGQWGTYRHLVLHSMPRVPSNHTYVNVTTRGDLSSLSWIQGHLNVNERNVIRVFYGAVNFRDVMTASGRISVDAVTNDRLEQECVQGFEYSGIDSQGRRVMGMLTSGALSTILTADPDMILEVPDKWTLEEAVTVPVVYGTVLYAFFMRAQGLHPDQTVLIHSGTGGVGQAAITIALFFKCKVFVTVGTPEKKVHLLKKFPRLVPENIGCSRDVAFEHLILERTNGHGVDLVLNSLAEDKLQASLRCLADNGHFLEIGKFDLSMDNNLDTNLLQRGISVHGIMLDGLFKTTPERKRYLIGLLQKVINMGAVVPLERTVFDRDDLEKAFRYMASGKHVGKVVIQVRNDPGVSCFPAVPKFYCPVGRSCLVVGGLGGFGLELCDWLVLRGCRNLNITSRHGPQTGYQHLRLQTWRRYGCTVNIFKEKMNTPESCENVLEKCPNLESVFNLAAVLRDGLLENQSVEGLEEVLEAKATTTKNLDLGTRKRCPGLKHFVVFSSVSCGRGNIAQVNYGMANSIVERIIEQRKGEGLPALAIQWGSIADVGLAAELLNDELNERPIGGTLPQRISNCLELMDHFLAQDEPIVASMVVAEKRGGAFLADNMVNTVVSIIGLRDLKTVSMHSTLPELGMDSMMAVEIKQTLEREYEVFLSPHDIRTLTFARLQELQGSKDTLNTGQNIKEDNVKLLLRFINDEECSNQGLVILPTIKGKSNRTVFFLPGVEGFATILEPLSIKLQCDAYGLQFCYDDPPDTLQEMARRLVPFVLPNQPQTGFTIVAYSFGCTVAVELAIILEQEHALQGVLVLIDGAHEMMLKLTHQQTNVNSPAEFEVSILRNICTIYMPLQLVDDYTTEMLQMDSYEERVNFVQSKSPEAQHSKAYIKKVCIAFHKRVRAVLNYKRTDYQLQSKITLIKPKLQSVTDIEQDYKLQEYTKRKVDIEIFDADHYTILDNDQVANFINQIVNGGFAGPEILTREASNTVKVHTR